MWKWPGVASDRLIKWMTVLAASFLAVPAAHAATQIVNANGQLIGATGVTVGTSTYDVSFVEGTCQTVFTGCDDTSDFDFTTVADAQAAAEALLAQVFVDGPLGAFDSNAALTLGCSYDGLCTALIPLFFASWGPAVQGPSPWNAGLNSPFSPDFVGYAALEIDADTTSIPSRVYARFTAVQSAVPEPGTWLMMLLGFGAVGMTMRGRSRTTLAQFA